ncbi:hypothetical protein HC766_02685 [Candidatus Gracilibacteria bacterium]|nr:hypothetical protein [Candidatus Gracilibacteria bacterium]NJS41265.1 hypothetical protein [Candidatus Gracilibacteria bacterium]
MEYDMQEYDDKSTIRQLNIIYAKFEWNERSKRTDWIDFLEAIRSNKNGRYYFSLFDPALSITLIVKNDDIKFLVGGELLSECKEVTKALNKSIVGKSHPYKEIRF